MVRVLVRYQSDTAASMLASYTETLIRNKGNITCGRVLEKRHLFMCFTVTIVMPFESRRTFERGNAMHQQNSDLDSWPRMRISTLTWKQQTTSTHLSISAMITYNSN